MSELFTSPDIDSALSDGEWHYLRVAVERGIDRGGGAGGSGGAAFTYRSATPIEVGRRVEVPLGRGNVHAAGVVVETGGPELCDGLDPVKVKSIVRDAGVGLPARLVELARWISNYYVCPLGMSLAAMMPAAVKKRTGAVLREWIERIEPASEAALVEIKLPKATRAAWDAVVALGRDAMPLSPDDLVVRIGAASIAPINRLVAAGLLRRTEREDVRSIGGAPAPTLIEQRGPGTQAIGALRLSSEQQAAVEGIARSLGAFGVHLLYGVTGSGKTEVYLRVLQRALEQGRTALVLVPEIALTPQTAGRFEERFGSASGGRNGASGVAILHSGLSASQRHAQWAAAASGKARVVVGARSAVFAPLENLGVIIVDEEHAGDYKQDQLPRYHGRDVAIKRAQLEGCPVVLGTATPSLESWANATGSHGTKYSLWRLRERVGGGAMPRVEVVDMRQEWKIRSAAAAHTGIPTAPAREHLLGPTLERALARTLRDDGQAILLLNRRGYSCYVACAEPRCGFVLSCDECDARLVEHRAPRDRDGAAPPHRFLRCHHCLAQQTVPARCPVCQGRMQLLGMGTQRVEDEIRAKFARLIEPPGRADDGVQREPAPRWLARVDGDTMRTGREFHELLERFARGEVRVLVGTQMLAKGHDFPNVRLVGVINADTALSLPDFRAAERTFQLVSQVAGRAGRGEHAGLVIVQTLEPDAPAIVHAANHDFESFASEELACRAAAGLPPATRMARVVCRDTDAAKAQDAAALIAEALRESAASIPGVRIDGPMPCPIARIARQHRVAVEVVAPQRGMVQDLLGRARARGLLKSDAHTAVDVDPIALL
ncbi:MAG: primosomal protein N' [Phycisphaeraceae bacterium]|nr:primosomal protein N' [Phycisphaeraceae bacterium]